MRVHLITRRRPTSFSFGEAPNVAALGDFRPRIREWVEAFDWVATVDSFDEVAETRQVDTEGEDHDNEMRPVTVSSIIHPAAKSLFVFSIRESFFLPWVRPSVDDFTRIR